MKTLLLAPVLLVGSLLGGCEINNEDMKSVIEACKADEECMEIINEEIDAALEERGYYDDDYYFDYEFTEEEEAMWTVLEDLEEEFDTKIDEMTDEQLEELWGEEFEVELTAEEEAAFELVDELYETIDWDQFEEEYDEDLDEEDFEDWSEVDFLKEALGRELTPEEIQAVELTEAVYERIDEMYENMTEVEYAEMELGRELTETEKASVEIVEGLYESVDWDAIEETEEFDHEESEDMSEVEFLESTLNRTLTEEEKQALTVVEGLYDEYFELEANYIVSEYEEVLGRQLTDEEKEALEYFYMEEVID